LVAAAVDTFGDLHVLINNAGFIRDRALVNMTEEEWDAIMRVHLKGVFAPTRWAATYWRTQAKASGPVKAGVLNMTSTSRLMGNVLYIQGSKIQRFELWALTHAIEKDSRWSLEDLDAALPKLLN